MFSVIVITQYTFLNIPAALGFLSFTVRTLIVIGIVIVIIAVVGVVGRRAVDHKFLQLLGS